MMDLYNKFWRWSRGIALLIALVITIIGFLCSFGHPIDVDIHVVERIMLENEVQKETEEKEAHEAKERMDNGNSTPKDVDTYYDWLERTLASDGPSSGNDGGGTYTQDSRDREPAGRDS